jgi:CheY-like chemotaxis protein
MFIASVISARTAADGPSLSFFNHSICSGSSHTFSFWLFRGAFSSGSLFLVGMGVPLTHVVQLDGDVLVVEDDESIRRMLMEYLKEHSPREVKGARDGVDALHHILTRRYAVVVLDMMMPKMSGGDLLDSLKAMSADPSMNLPEPLPAIIVVTGAPENELPDETIEQRFPGLVQRIFRKPVHCDQLVTAVLTGLTGCRLPVAGQ